jgi:CheY-like chemotaxis protein
MAADNDGTADTSDRQKETGKSQQPVGDNRSRIQVLHVDDAQNLVEIQREHLEEHNNRIEVDVAQTAVRGIERLAEGDFDCIVSDYAMPGMNGVEFCETIREEYPELPFILYTSRPCGSVATELLSAGVTDYVQKENGRAHLAILADRIITAVESRRTRRTQDALLESIEVIADGVALLNGDGQFTYVNDAYADHVDTDAEALVGEHLGRIFQGDPNRSDTVLAEAERTGSTTTTLQIAGQSEEHVLVQTARNQFVCVIRRPGSEQPSGE